MDVNWAMLGFTSFPQTFLLNHSTMVLSDSSNLHCSSHLYHHHHKPYIYIYHVCFLFFALHCPRGWQLWWKPKHWNNFSSRFSWKPKLRIRPKLQKKKKKKYQDQGYLTNLRIGQSDVILESCSANYRWFMCSSWQKNATILKKEIGFAYFRIFEFSQTRIQDTVNVIFNSSCRQNVHPFNRTFLWYWYCDW